MATAEHGSKGIKLNNNSLTLQVDDLSVCVQKKHLAEESVNSCDHLLMFNFTKQLTLKAVSNVSNVMVSLSDIICFQYYATFFVQ